ncbi:MAG: glycosyltransferase, partial [bacterium]
MLLVYDGDRNKTKLTSANYKFQKIAYFSTYFPRYSESAVYREFLKLVELEFEVESIALYSSDPGPIPNDAMGLMDSTVAIEDIGFLSRTSTHLKRMFTSPIKYWKAFFKQLFDAPFFKRKRFETLKLFSAGVMLARTVEKKKIEHLHVHHADKPASVALTAHRLTGIPYSITSYSKDLFGKNPDLKAKLENATWVTTISRFHKNYLLDFDPFLEKEKVEVVPVGVDLSIFTPEKDEKNLLQKPRVLAITRLTQNSGVDLLIKASKILASLNVDFETVIVGDGPERERLQSITNKLRLNRHVRLAGARRIEEILDLMRKADVFV